MRIIFGIIFFCILSMQAFAEYDVKGIITDQSNKPLEDVVITVPALHLHTFSNRSGEFKFTGLPDQTLLFNFTLIGFQSKIIKINPSEQKNNLQIKLKVSPLKFDAITVTAEPQPSYTLETPLTTSSIDMDNVMPGNMLSVGKTVAQLPGVNEYSGGDFSIKPVIRGLMGRRVIVLSNGVRSESQSWDEPQSPEISTYGAERIEVVRGPNSVLYGSDALGGLVNVINPDFITGNEINKKLYGNISLNGGINAAQGGGSLLLRGGSEDIGYLLQGSGHLAGDYSTPGGTSSTGEKIRAGEVFNSGIEQFSGRVLAGMNKNWGTLSLSYSLFGQNYFITPEPGRLEYEYNIFTKKIDTLPAQPHQEILHHRVNADANLIFGKNRVEINATFQNNDRKEEGIVESEEVEQEKERLGIKPEVDLMLTTYDLEIKAHHQPLGPVFGTIGVSGIYQVNETMGDKAIIPGYQNTNFAAFAYEEYKTGNFLNITGGIRYDIRSMNVDANEQLGNFSQTLDYNALTGILGLAFHLKENLILALNYGRGWRAPVAQELFGLGADEGEIRYKIGNDALIPEKSTNLEASLRYHSAKFFTEISVYRNLIDDFIYLKPAGEKIEGLDAYKYSQNKVQLYGGEFNAGYEVTSWFVASLAADMVIGETIDSVSYLPLMPAPRIMPAIKFLTGKLWGIENPYLIISGKYSFEQNRLAEFEQKTPAYELFDLNIGGTFVISGRKITCDIGVQNLLDKAYFDHLSRYKAFALNPGRSLFIRLSTPLDFID